MLYERSPATAGVLSLIYPGLGHLYVGHLNIALAIQVAIYGSLISLGSMGWLSSFNGALLFFITFLATYLFSIWHSARLAKQSDQYFQPKAYNSWWGYIGFVLAWQLGFSYLSYTNTSLLGVEVTIAKNAAMVPAIDPGEWVLINSRDKQVEPGDVVAFYTSEVDIVPSISRVVAVGGDRVSIIYGQVYRNGEIDMTTKVPEVLRRMDHSMSMEERMVPPGQIFVLGDFRDQSQDSRFFGTIPEKLMVGTVTDVLLSFDFGRLGQSVR